jgi:hypothetical protein
MKEALRTSETSVFTRATRRNIPEDAILHSHRSENLKSYILLPVQKHAQLILGDLTSPSLYSPVEFGLYNKITPKFSGLLLTDLKLVCSC